MVAAGCSLGDEAESRANTLFKEKNIQLTIDLNLGTAATHVWTTDLSYDYVKINADYHS